MNANTGVFTAPRTGVYFFLFSGLKDNTGTIMGVLLQVNGDRTGLAWADGANSPQKLTATVHATLTLQAGDKVTLTLDGGLYDNFQDHYTSYSGWLLEENVFE